MGATTRSSADGVLGKRGRSGSGEAAREPTMEPTDLPLKPTKIPKGGRRGAALLKAAGVTSERKEAIDKQYRQSPPVSRPKVEQARSSQRLAKKAAPVAGDPLQHQVLPTKLIALKKIFIAVHALYDMLRRRGKRTTFALLKVAVEEATGQRLLESHLYQLQTLVPEVLTVETVKLPIAPRSTRTCSTLVLNFSAAALSQPASHLRSLVHRRLARHLLDAYAAHLRSTARESHAGGDAVEAKELEKAAQVHPPVVDFLPPFPEGVPDVGNAVHLCGGGSRDDGSQISSPNAMCSTATRVTFSPKVPPAAAPAGKEPVRRRRLSFVPSTASLSALRDSQGKDDASILDAMPGELRRRSLEGLISMDALRTLDANEVMHRRFSSQHARETREASAILGALPKIFSRVQRIFGPRGPSAMKLNDALEKLRQGGPAAMATAADAETLSQLRCLAEHAPEYVQIKPWGGCGTPALWITRGVDMSAVADTLKAVAERRLA